MRARFWVACSRSAAVSWAIVASEMRLFLWLSTSLLKEQAASLAAFAAPSSSCRASLTHSWGLFVVEVFMVLIQQTGTTNNFGPRLETHIDLTTAAHVRLGW